MLLFPRPLEVVEQHRSNSFSSNDLAKYAKITVATLTSKENWFS
jgi:hypothetical protein